MSRTGELNYCSSAADCDDRTVVRRMRIEGILTDLNYFGNYYHSDNSTNMVSRKSCLDSDDRFAAENCKGKREDGILVMDSIIHCKQ